VAAVVGGFVSRFSFGANKPAPASAVHVTDTSTLREQATEFAADRTPIGPLAIRATSHMTHRDLDDDGEPDRRRVHDQRRPRPIELPPRGGRSGLRS
jgi:hypothetical protein